MIKQISLNHGWFYYYRIHEDKIKKLPSRFTSLKNYLNLMLTNCPNEHFNSDFRSSRLKIKLSPKLYEISGHEICSLTQRAIEYNNSSHSNIQVFLLKNDQKTIAVEIPVWITQNEFPLIKKTLTGHIDILRLENNKLEIWDYKPNLNEKYISTQLFFYALMLSKRINIPLNNFICGYFNKEKAFIFKPEENLLWNNN